MGGSTEAGGSPTQGFDRDRWFDRRGWQQFRRYHRHTCGSSGGLRRQRLDPRRRYQRTRCAACLHGPTVSRILLCASPAPVLTPEPTAALGHDQRCGAAPSTAPTTTSLEDCSKCGGPGSAQCTVVSSKACTSGQWPEVHCVSDNEPWHYSRSTHFGLTYGGLARLVSMACAPTPTSSRTRRYRGSARRSVIHIRISVLTRPTSRCGGTSRPLTAITTHSSGPIFRVTMTTT